MTAWLGASLIIDGNLTSSEDTTIAGKVNGDVTVRGHTLTVASGAAIKGDIVARSVAVHGEVIGSITTEGTIEVGETGSVEGEIKAARMALTEGAVLRCRVKMSRSAT